MARQSAASAVAAPYNPRMEREVDVVVRGGGAVGQSLALALGRQGLLVGLAAPEPAVAAGADVRAYALNAASRALLRDLKVWDALPPSAVTPVDEMQVTGDAPGAGLAFSAWQQGAEALAWIVEVPALERALQEAVRFSPHVTRLAEGAGPVRAPLTAICEGKASQSRAQLGVSVRQDRYGQQAVAARLVGERPHGGCARQWFGSPEVLALLPMDAPQPGRSLGLVWSVPDERAERLLALPAPEFEQSLRDASGDALGRLELVSERKAWPLVRSRVDPWCGPGWVLVGDAAHGVHPLAGQGLNLGLADVACLARVLSNKESWRGLGDDRLLRRYARERAAPTRAMDAGIDGLWQLFAAPGAGARELRNLGLNLVNRLPPLKRWLAGRALGF